MIVILYFIFICRMCLFFLCCGLVWLHTECHTNHKLTLIVIFNMTCFVLSCRCVVFHPLASTPIKSSRFQTRPQTFKVNLMIYFFVDPFWELITKYLILVQLYRLLVNTSIVTLKATCDIRFSAVFGLCVSSRRSWESLE